MKKEIKKLQKLKQYLNIYVFKVNKETDCKKTKNKNSWKNFLISTKNAKENVSENIHSILYDKKIF
ncbi:MAG: hypothetical protein US83_C0020G0005 [Candidatus Falkowbacteria bacterium GW2011_GWC2_38_22]|nr:MAG: hypothetical protein US83_C0020G0005 [Candidatus Falkowbacteria bacterium GW2011_GWC2_38_22]KKQ62372.1 MAG: hypothetical protein US84_C0018G0006 [Candidatus Falkowbacteria bacterium GW2011_GWF1_38_22]KKQ71578.1 MAG: hypothetical protein US93_C0017G0006 [Candidatus Falkowbacteria bacterium GW2011_GWD2_38_42]HAM88879.1 hypothetical protein [Candidatus Falkowbacteria bacterium]HAY12672.1 hypothetical protein [Candidatus Falkowbacteria bacterium]